MLAWLTKNSLPSASAEYVIRLPVDVDWQADFFGALVPLMDSRNWEQFEALTPDEMADAWREKLLNQLWGLQLAIPVGTIVAWAGINVPLDWLRCDGAEELRSDWPKLFEIIGTTYGSAASDTFTLPNLLGKFPLGVSGTHALATVGGAENHTLTQAELPSLMGFHFLFPFGTGGSTRGAINNLTDTTTQVSITNSAAVNVGGSQPHNNMPPFLSLDFIIKAK